VPPESVDRFDDAFARTAASAPDFSATQVGTASQVLASAIAQERATPISALPDLTRLPYNITGKKVSTAASLKETTRLKAETERTKEQIKQAQERDEERDLQLEELHREEMRLLIMKRDEHCRKIINDIKVDRPWFSEELESAEPYHPKKYLCSISQELMDNPVHHSTVAPNDHFDKLQIEQWLNHNTIHPITGKEVQKEDFQMDRQLKDEIERYKAYRESPAAAAASDCFKILGMSVPRFLNSLERKGGGKRRNKRKKSKRNNSKRKSHKRKNKSKRTRKKR